MKQLTFSIAVIVVLIIFFVITDRNEFNRYNDVNTVQSDNYTTNRKTAVSIPKTEISNEANPIVEGNPVVEVISLQGTVETNSMNETKSMAAKTPVIEARTVEFTQIVYPNKSAPFAVPVITQEEAIKVNEEAIRFQQAKINERKNVARNGLNSAPMAIPVLTPEEAKSVNIEAIKFRRHKAFINTLNQFFTKVGLANNLIYLIVSLFPLLLIIDALGLKKTKKKCNKVSNDFSLSRRVQILLPVSLLAFGILVFVPWSVYFGNSLHFPFIFKEFVNWNLCVLTISIVGVSIILLLIPPGISDYLVAVIAGLGLCVYIQAMFMNQHLGTMDGMEPAWREHRLFGTINVIIWIAIVFLPIILRKVTPVLFSKVISTTTGIVLFLEFLATASTILSAGQNVWARENSYYVNGEKQFQLSKEKNIVVFFIDTFDSGFVSSCFEASPETKEIVKDFVWYKDARSNYLRTFPGLINELTGSLVIPAKTYTEMFDKMWHTPAVESFFKQIYDAGYDARFYVNEPDIIVGPTNCFHDYFSNIEARPDVSYEIDYCSLYHCLALMSAYSSSPFSFKKYFFYSFDFSDNIVQKRFAGFSSIPIPRHNHEFLETMTASGISSDANKPILSYHYIIGAHPPWHHDEKCNYIQEAFDNPIPTVRGCFHIISEFIRRLKGAGLYDNTAIVIIADHGNFMKGYTPDITFMIKPFHENKTELSIDDSKVQSIDLLPTLLNMMCGDNAVFKDFDGYPSNCIPNERIRKVYSVVNNPDFPPFDAWVGQNCVEEYNYVDRESFSLGTDSKLFIRQFPLMRTSQENK